MPVDGRALLDEILVEDVPSVSQQSQTVDLKFTVKRFIFQTLLEKAAAVIPRRDVMPVLKNYYIELAAQRLRIVATDLELSIVTTTELVDIQTPGVAVFPAQKLLEIVKESDGDEVDIQVRATTATIRIGRTTWTLRLQGGSDYPPMPQISEAVFSNVDKEKFANALNVCKYAACKDANRASLMMVDVRGGRMTACDGARFQQASVPSLSFDFQIPIGAVNYLLKLLRSSELPEISIGESAHHLIFRLGADVLIVNKLMAQIPDLEAQWLRPALENKYPLSVERADLLTAIKRVRINADPETSAIVLALSSGAMTISAKDKYGNLAAEEIEAQWEGGGRVLVVNHGYLMNLVEMASSATLYFMLGDDLKTRKSPILLRDEENSTVGVVQQMLGDWVI